jgi:hypothetical protein
MCCSNTLWRRQCRVGNTSQCGYYMAIEQLSNQMDNNPQYVYRTQSQFYSHELQALNKHCPAHSAWLFTTRSRPLTEIEQVMNLILRPKVKPALPWHLAIGGGTRNASFTSILMQNFMSFIFVSSNSYRSQFTGHKLGHSLLLHFQPCHNRHRPQPSPHTHFYLS